MKSHPLDHSQKAGPLAFTRRPYKTGGWGTIVVPALYAVRASLWPPVLVAVRTCILRLLTARVKLANVDEIALQNARLSESVFEIQQPDSLFIPYGDAPHPSGVLQRFDRQAGQALANAFHGIVGTARRILNAAAVPIYAGHPDVPGKQQVYTDRTAKGWVTGIAVENDGVRVAVKWNAEGADLVGNAKYKFYSPYWLSTTPTADKITRPVQLISIGLTNTPNIPVPAIANDQEQDHPEHESMKLKPETLTLLGLAVDSEPDVTALENAIIALHGRATSAQSRVTTLENDLSAANTKLTEHGTRATEQTSRITALENELNSAGTTLANIREKSLDIGLLLLKRAGYLSEADQAAQRARLLALPNAADIATELEKLGEGQPKYKTQSVVNAGGAGAAIALSNDAELRRHEFARLVKEEQLALENSGTDAMTAYAMAHNKILKTHGELLKPAA